ncbi:hypothetical protein D3C84_609630 [compost metagenome]
MQNELKLDQFTNKNISENTTVKWNSINVFKKDSLEVYEIELVEKNDIKIKSKHFQADLKYELIAVKQNNVIHSYLIEAFSSAKNKLFSGTIQDLNSYSGTLNIYDLNGKQINQLLVKNGNARNTSNNVDLEPLKNAINMFYKPSKKNLTNRLPDCTMKFRVPIHHDIYKEEYKVVTYDTGELIDIFYLGTKLIDTYNTYTYMSVEYPCDSSADEVHIPYTTIVRNNVTVSSNSVVLIAPKTKITNINDYLKCFNLSQRATLTIYVQQPTANSPEAWSGIPLNPRVGHSFIALQQGSIRRVLGYYPKTLVDPESPNDPKEFGNDEGHSFDVSLSTPINSTQLLNIIGYCNNAPATYNLNTYNCTDFVIAVGNFVGLGLPDSYGAWWKGGGSNPGQLGQNIRNMSLPSNASRQTTSTNAANNSGTCN